jgi:hypothetical protein
MDNEQMRKQQAPAVTQWVPVSSIVVSATYQMRNKVDPGTVRRYANVLKSGNDLPPITLAKINGVLHLVDGFHRLEAMTGEEVEAVVIETTAREALWLAASANLKNGLPLKTKELKKVFRSYIRARRHYWKSGELKSYREIARELGGIRSYATIHSWMRKEFPKIAEQYTKEQQWPAGGFRDSAYRLDSATSGTMRDLNNALAKFDGIANANDRGVVIQRAEEVLRGMKQSAGVEREDF